MKSVQQNLRRKILQSPNDSSPVEASRGSVSHPPFLQVLHILRYTKVCKHNVALFADKDVARLDVSVYQACSVDGGHCSRDPGCQVKEFLQ
jgi:hypothetical protein